MRLSVIIPTYNRSKLITQAIDSILRQQPPVYEIVVADDCSTDDTHQVCQAYQQADTPTRVVWTSSEKNLGAQFARNRGLAASTGDAVMFMDSDDAISKQGILPLVEQLQKEDLDYVYGRVVRTDQFLCPVPESEVAGKIFSDASVDIAGYHWHTMGAIYRKDYLRLVGAWDEHLTGSQDWEFQSRVKLAGGRGQFVPHTVGFWRDHTELRVGTKQFRYDYVESVMKACLLIHQRSLSAGRLDAALERRLVKKMLLHALEMSVNGYPCARQFYMQQALNLLYFNPLFKLAIYALLLMRSSVDPILWKQFATNVA